MFAAEFENRSPHFETFTAHVDLSYAMYSLQNLINEISATREDTFSRVAFDIYLRILYIDMFNNVNANVEFDNQMNMAENLAFSFGFLLVWAAIYLLLRWLRPNAEKSHEMALDLVAGSAVNLSFWFVLLLFGTYLLNSNESFFSIMDLVLDTRIIFVPWAYLSYALVAFGFQLDKVSKGQVDWRMGFVLLSVCLTLVFSVYYFSNGIPTTSFSLP
ncbi:hypothetical protein MUO79_01420 [Candidatus Bathyarchaeota archaeon]|nr:hypothetical protein [Candidatus Bathyarchaeota archaeon]